MADCPFQYRPIMRLVALRLRAEAALHAKKAKIRSVSTRRGEWMPTYLEEPNPAAQQMPASNDRGSA